MPRQGVGLAPPMGIRFALGAASGGRFSVTVSTPLSKAALAWAGSAAQGSRMLRRKLP